MCLLLVLLSMATASASDLALGFTPNPGPGEDPALLITPARAVAELVVLVEAGGRDFEFRKQGLPAGVEQRFSWARDTAVTSVVATISAEFTDGYAESMSVPIEYSYSMPLSVSLDGAVADLAARTLTVTVTAPVEQAAIKAYGAHKALLDERTVPIGQGPGRISIPWVGEPEDVVLLDVTLGSGGAWSGFTYSPWFLDIPHEDVRFETDQATVLPAEEEKLRHTLAELQEVQEKYGSVVPVQLYIAGCTDTVGDAAHNRELSQRRARSIGAWLRAHGYKGPIFTWGFGEDLLAVPTGDGVDEIRNRRALYMVGANPPPAGSGVPAVGWRAL